MIQYEKRKDKTLFGRCFYRNRGGLLVGFAYYFFQNSNGFALGGVGGLATITFHSLQQHGVQIPWVLLMVFFNAPIFVLVSIFVNRRLGLLLLLYLVVQSLATELFAALQWEPYCRANNAEDFEMVLACIATGVISGLGFSMMLRRFGAYACGCG